MTEWINVNDRPPPFATEVIIYRHYLDREFSCTTGGYTGKQFKTISIIGIDITYTEGVWERYGGIVTHWMPLPEPPK